MTRNRDARPEGDKATASPLDDGTGPRGRSWPGRGIPGPVVRSVADYGFAALDDRIAPVVLQALRAEAEDRLASALAAEQSCSLSYRASITGLGQRALAFLHDWETRALLTRLFGGEYALTEQWSCLTCYRTGDHLGAHLDEPASDCAVTIIIYLTAQSPDPLAADTGLVLKIYGERPETVGRPRLSVPTRVGTIVHGRGSRIWHERPKLLAGETVVASTGCYRQTA